MNLKERGVTLGDLLILILIIILSTLLINKFNKDGKNKTGYYLERTVTISKYF